jgi:hypothetical protein
MADFKCARGHDKRNTLYDTAFTLSAAPHFCYCSPDVHHVAHRKRNIWTHEMKRHRTAMSVATRLRDLTFEEPGFDSRQGWKIHIFSKTFRPGLEPTQRPMQGVPGVISPPVSRPRREAHHTPCSADVKNEWRCTSTPPYVFMACTGTTLLHLTFKKWKVKRNREPPNVYRRTECCAGSYSIKQVAAGKRQAHGKTNNSARFTMWLQNPKQGITLTKRTMTANFKMDGTERSNETITHGGMAGDTASRNQTVTREGTDSPAAQTSVLPTSQKTIHRCLRK